MSHYEVFYIYSVQNCFICSVQISFSILLPHFFCFYPSIRTMQQIKRRIIYSKYTFLIPSIQLHVFSVHSQQQSLDDKHFYIYKRDKKKVVIWYLGSEKKKGIVQFNDYRDATVKLLSLVPQEEGTETYIKPFAYQPYLTTCSVTEEASWSCL